MINAVTKYGWLFLLIAVIGEMVAPFILAPRYKGYSHTTMAISALGSRNSPVRLPFNLWMLVAGILLLLSTPAVYKLYGDVSKPLSILTVLCMVIFAIGACIFSCLFSVNETKDVVTIASKIHGVGSAIGFMFLLFVPLLIAILSFMSGDKTSGIIATTSFVLALTCFALFVMADKPQFHNTVIAKEGLWQRLNLVFMYFPLAYLGASNIVGGRV